MRVIPRLPRYVEVRVAFDPAKLDPAAAGAFDYLSDQRPGWAHFDDLLTTLDEEFGIAPHRGGALTNRVNLATGLLPRRMSRDRERILFLPGIDAFRRTWPDYFAETADAARQS